MSTVLVFGGTTEGRQAAAVLEEAGSPFFYSTKTGQQHLPLHHGSSIHGPLDGDAMTAFCLAHSIRLIVDAAHPFAEQLHHNVARVAEDLDIPVVRWEREYPPLESPCVACDDYADLIQKVFRNAEQREAPLRVVALTGVQTIGPLSALWRREGVECWFRILDRDDSRQKAAAWGFPPERLLSESDPLPPCDLILTKESGHSGGFQAKVQQARERGVPLLVVRRPLLPSAWTIVTGTFGLRRAVEQLCPGFFPLRSGFTTGSCATAAAVAATHVLLGHDHPQEARFRLPGGEWMVMPVARTASGRGWASAVVIKDAGDDPDVTHGTEIVARVEWRPTGAGRGLQPARDSIAIRGGCGVGRVTLPGLGLPVGSAAINPVPQLMIRQSVEHELSGMHQPVDITISVPEGRRLALRTFNSRVGVVDGISIIGTRGIVQPFSSEAFVEAIRREMQVAKAMGIGHVVLSSGARSEGMVKEKMEKVGGEESLPPQAFIHYGNFIGEALQLASELHFPHVTLCVMIGKAVKLAAGHLNTHSHQVVMDKAFLARLADEAGCSPAATETIASITLARELTTRLSPSDHGRFIHALHEACLHTARKAYAEGRLELLLMTS